MATADQTIAREQLRHLRGRRFTLVQEAQTLLPLVVQARRQEIQDQLVVLDAQIAAIAPRAPPDDPVVVP